MREWSRSCRSPEPALRSSGEAGLGRLRAETGLTLGGCQLSLWHRLSQHLIVFVAAVVSVCGGAVVVLKLNSAPRIATRCLEKQSDRSQSPGLSFLPAIREPQSPALLPPRPLHPLENAPTQVVFPPRGVGPCSCPSPVPSLHTPGPQDPGGLDASPLPRQPPTPCSLACGKSRLGPQSRRTPYVMLQVSTGAGVPAGKSTA